MSVKSKFYQVTNQILLEYQTNQYEINTKQDSDTSTSFYMYQGLDGKQYCIEEGNLSHWRLSMEDGTSFYPGRNVREVPLDGDITNYTVVYGSEEPNCIGQDISFNGTVAGYVIKDADGEQERSSNVFKDRIRLHILSGYVMNSLAGITVRVRAKVNLVKAPGKERRMQDYVTMLDWFMPKEMLREDIKWHDTPLYLNSKFYDRHIDIEFPSPYNCAMYWTDVDYVYESIENSALTTYRGSITKYSDILVDFATVQPVYMKLRDEESTDYASTFTPDAPQTLAIKMTSNSDNFNIRLHEDTDTNTILYYPVYGDDKNSRDLDVDVMYAIEAGNIPMLDMSDYDSANSGMDDFIEMYGDEVNRWIIMNELGITYNYQYMIAPNNNADNTLSVSEYFTNTIDYTGKTDEHGQFWRSRFVPYIKRRNNMFCTSIVIEYTCHLYNRMNGMDIIRRASMVVDDPKRYESRLIDTTAITQYKIVNKITRNQLAARASEETTKEKFVRSYYDVTDLVVKDVESGNMYSQGQMTLRLKHSGSNYMLRLYELSDNNVRVPYDLSGATRYKLVFPTTSGRNIEVFPNQDSTNYNLGIGSIVFYISDAQSKQIMGVPASDRWFSLMTDTDGEETTLYEGKTDYYS